MSFRQKGREVRSTPVEWPWSVWEIWTARRPVQLWHSIWGAQWEDMESEWKQESRHRNSEAIVKTVVYSQWNGEAGRVMRGVVAWGDFCVNKIPLVSLWRIYQGAKAEGGRAVGRSLGSSRWDEGSVDLGDSSGDDENRWDSGWILPLPFYCENVQVYTEVSTHRITIWVLIDTWLFTLLYIYPFPHPVPVPSLSLEHPWFNFCKNSPSVSFCDNVVICSME